MPRLKRLAERRCAVESPSREEGQGLAEYAWTIILMAILLIIILGVLGMAVFDLWAVVSDAWIWVWSQV
jgi:hypothetical protein